MSPLLSPIFLGVCLMGVLAGLLGWFTPKTTDGLKWREAGLCFVGVGFACWWGGSFSGGMNFLVFFLGVYLAFNGWQNEPTLPKSACSGAFFGAAFLLGTTSQRADHVAIGYLVSAACYFFALWLGKGPNRRVALVLVCAAALFQLSRMSVMLSS